MASRPRKAPTVDSSAPWFGRHLRKRTAPELRGYEFSYPRTLKKFQYDENGQDVRVLNPGVNWKVLSELRATYKLRFEEGVEQIFYKHIATLLPTSRQSTQHNLVLDIDPQVVRSTRSQKSFGRKPVKDIPQAGSQGEKAVHTSENEGVTMETTATSRETRSKRSKGHHNQKADDIATDFEVAISDLHPSVDVGHQQSTQSHTRKDSVLHPIVDLTNTPYQRSTRSHTKKDSIPMGKSDDQNAEHGLATAPLATAKEVPISTNCERGNGLGEELGGGAKPHLPQPIKRATRARKQKRDNSRESEERRAPENVVSDGVGSRCEASISECKDSLPSTTVKRSARARTRRQKAQLGSDSDTSGVCPETVPSAPPTKRVTRSRTRKAPTADAFVSEWDLSLVDTASHRTTRSRTKRAVPEAEMIVPAHQHASRVSDGVEIITEERSGHAKTSSDTDCTKASSEDDHTETSCEADRTKSNNEPQDGDCGLSNPTLAEESLHVPGQPGMQTLPVPDSTPKPQETSMDTIDSPHPEPIEAAGVKDGNSPCHTLPAISSSSDIHVATEDCSYAADTEDECVPSKRPRASKRLPLKLKKRRKKRKASTSTKRRKVEIESEANILDAVDNDDKERTAQEQPITGDHTEAGCVEAESSAKLTESLYESCVEDVDTPNCTSACPSGADELSSQLKVSAKASRIPAPTKSAHSNSISTPQTYNTKSRPALSPADSSSECTEPNPTLPSTPQTYIKSTPALPSAPQTYNKSRPGFSPTVPAPQTSTCTKLRPALSSATTIPAPQTSTCTKSKPALSPATTIPAPQTSTFTKSRPAIPVPQMGTRTKLRPALTPTSVPYLTGTPKTIKMLQEEHCTQNRSNVVSFSELMASKGRTPQSPQVTSTVTKTFKSPAKPSIPAKPSAIPVPVRSQLSGTKRLRSVSLEKLPRSLAAKRPSRTRTPDSTHTESTTSSSDGTERFFRSLPAKGSSPDSVGGDMDSQEFVPSPDTPFVPALHTPATPSQLREAESAESFFTSSSASSSEKTDQYDTTPYSTDGGDSRNTHASPSRLRQPGLPSSGKPTSTDTGNSKENRTTTKEKLSLWSILEQQEVSKLTFHAPSDLPVSFLPHTPLKKQDTLDERLMKRVEKVQQKKEEVEKRKRELEAKKQRDLQDKIRRREERAKRVAENQAVKQREEEERKRRAQGQWVHEEQVKRITQKKAKEMEERNRKHKERMQAAEVRRRQEDEMKMRHLQQMQEDRRMAEELARKRLEQEEEEKRQRRQEKHKLERERHLQREHEAEMKRLQEEEDRQQAEKQQRRQEELRKMQDQARKEEEKKKFEQLLTGSGSKFVKPLAPPPSQPASNTNKFIQQWKQLKTQAGDFFSTVTKSNPPQGQQISPIQEEGSVLNTTFTKDTTSEFTTDAATGAPVTQSSATPVRSSKTGKTHTPVSSYQMTPVQDDPLLYDNYDIGNLNSEDSTDDDECPRKQIPTWAQSQFLNTWIQSQEEEMGRNMIDIARLFPPEELLREPDLARIFRKKRKRFFDRTSSAQWTSPMLKKSRAECL